MPQIRIQLIAGLLLVSTVLSAPNSLTTKIYRGDGLKPGAEEMRSTTEGYQNESAASTADVSTGTISSERPRTLLMYGLLRWIFGIVKATIKPARNMYIMMLPEISAYRCLSDSREFQNFMGFSGSDFEGYVYETPRTSGRRQPLDDGQPGDGVPSDEGFSNEVYNSQVQQSIHPDTHNYSENYSYYGTSLSQNIQHRTDEVLKRFPRFIDEFASLLKEGQAMNCIMPYMRERVTRWIDG